MTGIRRLSVLLGLALAWLPFSEGAAQECNPSPNVITTVSERFVNESVQKTVNRIDPIVDCILGTFILGNGLTQGQVQADLIPNSQQAALDLVFTGTTDYRTIGYRDPVRMFNKGLLQFQLRKTVWIREQGVFVAKPWVRTGHLDSKLLKITTKFQCSVADEVARWIALRRYKQQRSLSECIIERHAEYQLACKFDKEAAPDLVKLATNRNRMLEEVKSRGLNLKHHRLTTNDDTLTVLAVVDTPGEKSPDAAPPPLSSEHDLTFTVHQSVMNEAARVTFAGKTYTEKNLQEELKQQFGLTIETPKSSTGKTAWTIRFDKRKPIVFDCDGDEITAVFAFERFTSGKSVYPPWNITVRYKFEQTSAGIEAVRHGPVKPLPANYEPGKPLGGGQIRAKGILSRRFEPLFKERIPLQGFEFPEELPLKGSLVPTHITTQNGWLVSAWKVRPRRSSSNQSTSLPTKKRNVLPN